MGLWSTGAQNISQQTQKGATTRGGRDQAAVRARKERIVVKPSSKK